MEFSKILFSQKLFSFIFNKFRQHFISKIYKVKSKILDSTIQPTNLTFNLPFHFLWLLYVLHCNITRYNQSKDVSFAPAYYICPSLASPFSQNYKIRIFNNIKIVYLPLLSIAYLKN
ncbi:hypothetical protein CW304_00735 [Bacillus sp. UFRGS-B20]|nr:hypothetical protein CW304_00735 [Bacillus sp. UFRGS-B20]